MSETAFSLAVTFEPVTCSAKGCGLVFAVPASWGTTRREDKATFYCPNGHAQYFPGKTDVEKARATAAYWEARAKEERAAGQRTERQLFATRGVVTRIKRRIGAGVCPCCRRSFQNLKRHMAGEHPLYVREAVTA